MTRGEKSHWRERFRTYRHAPTPCSPCIFGAGVLQVHKELAAEMQNFAALVCSSTVRKPATTSQWWMGMRKKLSYRLSSCLLYQRMGTMKCLKVNTSNHYYKHLILFNIESNPPLLIPCV
ncbi:hypothetical protein JTB14_004493 [Gonioctena quinquepunctata]|nr:hypothetical protein JTB14_004493 [Gonioctena quinquepunctata]